jgi:predicted dithiol-disulfide oxidoreductase (DUF899 family)
MIVGSAAKSLSQISARTGFASSVTCRLRLPPGCPSCSAIAEGFNRFVVQLANQDVLRWAAVSWVPCPRSRRTSSEWPGGCPGLFVSAADLNIQLTVEQQREGGCIGSSRWQRG